ncbi:DUF1801 domain-containing protein [Kordiimonas aestuarii]|uniref:DUF1801 domain-containing protein n=1 Tax=Kordiimonas aestuarii TaxID=1005925 RepID=UPI0021CF138E|nr:DUF1801 domain-containing protein [Kordiimonas aestuarii]
MAENKTRETDASVAEFLSGVSPEARRKDAITILELMERMSGHSARMWGPGIVGFGSYHYVYESGREGDMCRIGFSPRKTSLVLYIMPGFSDTDDLLARLGKHKTEKSCLYINKLADVDMMVIEEMIERALAYMQEKYPG